MKTKDALSKAFFGKPEIAADLCNGVIYQGKAVVLPENLKELPAEQVCGWENKGDGSYRADRRLRDLLFLCGAYTDSSMDYIILGVELQSAVDRRMLFRVMEYDARQYMLQLQERRRCRTGRMLPVVTFVVNLSGTPWGEPTSVHAMLGDIDPQLKPFVHDYRMNLLDPFSMGDNICGAFCTELKTVVNCLRFSRDRRQLKEFLTRDVPQETVSPEAAGLLSEFLNVELPKGQKEGVNMCQAMMEILRETRDEGKAEGIAAGRAEGKAEGQTEGRDAERERVVSTALGRNLSPRDIHLITGISLKTIHAIRRKLHSA